MKRLFLLLLIAITAMATTAAYAADKDQPAISIDNKSYDFGTIKEADGKATHEFSFTNIGSAPLVIINAAAGCGCVKVTYPDSPIAPGKSGVITATFNPRGQGGDFFKNITVRTNAPKNKKFKLSITGCVVPK